MTVQRNVSSPETGRLVPVSWEEFWKSSSTSLALSTLEINELTLVKPLHVRQVLSLVVTLSYLRQGLNMLLLSPSDSTDVAFWQFSWSVCRAGHWKPCEEASILPLPESRGLKEGVTIGHPPLLLESTLIMKLDSPSKACSPTRPKSVESNRFRCYPFKRSQKVWD